MTFSMGALHVCTVLLLSLSLKMLEEGLTVGGGLEKLSQSRNFFFLISARTQLSAYANHEFKIIPIPTQLSAYANHELKN